METDVVCGMRVDPATAAGSAMHDGKTYYFCGKGCLQRFQADPKKYLDPSYRPGMHAMQAHATTAPLTLRRGGPSDPPAAQRPAASLTPDDREYTCPMHPEVRQRGPGSCPICGMALEPVEASIEEAPNEELTDMSRRFWWSLALTTPMLVFMVSELLPGQPLHHLVSPRVMQWVEFALATPVVVWGGWPFLVRGIASVTSAIPPAPLALKAALTDSGST